MKKFKGWRRESLDAARTSAYATIRHCSLNPAVRYGSDKAGQVGSTPAASTRIKCACGRADLCIPFLPGTTGVRILPGAPARGRSMAGRWILVPTTSVRFTPSRPSLVRRHSTVGWPPYKGSTWVRLPAPQPCVIRVRSSWRGADVKPVLISGQAGPSMRPRVKDERAALNRQAVSSILTGRTNFPIRDRRKRFPGLWLNGEALDF
jgi:hypothetical protein